MRPDFRRLSAAIFPPCRAVLAHTPVPPALPCAALALLIPATPLRGAAIQWPEPLFQSIDRRLPATRTP
ncbi:hypothetical protein ATO3_02310 [Marinibacterium profundimaris]|uniref:Uncharacterized protein n=1 Tax=Marinibacterium profundimaris TaxID=1679460 RepID=A0A225NWB8_9RHOB|nr:hypothetical protein ATO3_02310 [Marinibacterium profundimaris]